MSRPSTALPVEEPLCSQHGVPLVPREGTLNPSDIGLRGGPYFNQIVLAGLVAKICPVCEAEGGASLLRLGAEERARARDLLHGAEQLLRRYDRDHSVRIRLDFSTDTSTPTSSPPPATTSPAVGTVPAAFPAGQGFVTRTPEFGLERLVFPPAVHRRLGRVATLLRHQETLAQWGLAKNSRPVLVFHGPPGTGKTLAAEALAHELGMPFVVIDAAALESKFVGDTPKNITAAFAAAERVKGLLFFDEADTFLGARIETPTTSADTGVNLARSTLLLALDRCTLPVIFATNLPRVVDSAFRRRVLDSIDFPLPDEEARKRILAVHLPAQAPVEPAPALTRELLLEQLARSTEGFSGGDLRTVISLAAAGAIQEHGPTGPIRLPHFTAAIDEVRATRQALGRPAPDVQITEVAGLPEAGSRSSS